MPQAIAYSLTTSVIGVRPRRTCHTSSWGGPHAVIILHALNTLNSAIQYSLSFLLSKQLTHTTAPCVSVGPTIGSENRVSFAWTEPPVSTYHPPSNYEIGQKIIIEIENLTRVKPR